MFFLLVFSWLQRAFPTFAKVKKLTLRVLFLLGFFMAVLGWTVLSGMGVFYCIGSGFCMIRFFVVFGGVSFGFLIPGRVLFTGTRCLPGFWGGIRSRGWRQAGARRASRLRFCSFGRVLARGAQTGRGWRGRGRCCFVVGWLLRRGVCGFFVGVWALLCRRR